MEDSPRNEQPTNRVAVVTGAASGIGTQVARRCVKEGYSVVIADLSRDGAQRVADELSRDGKRVLAIDVDVADEPRVASLFERTVETFGPASLLVNCAANLDPPSLVADMPRSTWDECVTVHLTGTFLCCREALKDMIPQRCGCIVNMSSVAGKMGYPFRAAYAAAKAGIISLTKTLAIECGPHNIRVNAICPGPTEGPRMSNVIAQRAAAQGRSIEDVANEYRATSPLKQFIRPDDIASLIVYLASTSGERITGQAIDIDAGFLLT